MFRAEERLREHEYTPDGVYKATLLTTGSVARAREAAEAARLADEVVRDRNRR